MRRQPSSRQKPENIDTNLLPTYRNFDTHRGHCFRRRSLLRIRPKGERALHETEYRRIEVHASVREVPIARFLAGDSNGEMVLDDVHMKQFHSHVEAQAG